MNIHPQLRQDCVVVGRFPLCFLLMMKDANYPWFILVPDREAISEIYELSDADQWLLTQESAQLAACLMRHYKGDKMNIAALGNVVPQLHIHHIVRYRDDAAWPAPVWGRIAPQPYSDVQLSAHLAALLEILPDDFQVIT